MAVLDLKNALQESLAHMSEETKKQPFVVACSGGFDSVVTAHLLVEALGKKSLSLLHFNFGLRGEESDREAAYVQELAEKWGVPCKVENAPEREKKTGTQEWARDIRQKSFRAFADSGHIVVTGHHKQDVAENVVLRMVRGSSVAKLAGMKVWDGTVFRPLLNVFPRDIRFYAKKNRLKACEDSSNATVEYSRNFIRHKILPLLEELAPGAISRVADSAMDAGIVAEFMQQEMLPDVEQGFPIEGWAQGKPDEVVTSVLGNWLSTWRPKMRRDFLRGIVRDVRSGKGFLARDLGKTHRLVMENGLIKICAKPSLPKAERFEQHRAGLQRDAQSAIWHTKAWKVQQIGKDKET